MKQIIVLCLMLASLALAQQRQIVVVLPSVAIDDDVKLTPNQLNSLTEEVRNIVIKTLPSNEFLLMKQDEVMEALGEEAFFKACDEKTCLGSLMEKVQADFGARCDVYTVEKQLRLKFELYGKPKGESKARTIGQFTEKAKDFAEMEAVIKREVPPIFDQIGKTEQERCLATPGKMWVDDACVTGKEMAQKDCLQKKDEGYVWDGESCKSRDQIICEGKKGFKWEGNDCKSPDWQACEKQAGKVWQNDRCISSVITAAPMGAPLAGGGGSGTFTAQVHTEPKGASVSVNGAPYCHSTPCPISLYENRIKLTVTLNDYETADTTLTITMPNQVVNINLNPKTYSVLFASDPDRATLSIEGQGPAKSCETPCRAYLSKGRVKVSAGSGRYFDRKDTTINITGHENQRIDLKLNPNYGTLELRGAGGWDVSVDDADYGSSQYNVRLLPGTHKIRLTNSDYEDIEFSTDIRKNEQKSYDISDKIVHRYGYLNINPSYSSGIGESENWYLQIDGSTYSFGEVKLLHGEHQVKLTHRCYEDITAEAKIERNGRTSFDMQEKVSLKQSTLVLRAKRKIRNISMPVFVNGKQVGETPYEGSIPICSEVKMGQDGKESVPVKLEHNKPVSYTYTDGTFKSHLLGVVLDITGAVFLIQSISALSDRDKAYDSYSELKPDGSPKATRSDYDDNWKKLEDSHSKGNTFLIIGGAALALGIGVHVWF